jgi:hypothetical protein
MTPRHGLIFGFFVAAAVALALAVAPTRIFEDLPEVSTADATSFLLRRYGASATAAVAVFAASVLRGGNVDRGSLLALGTWFIVQGCGRHLRSHHGHCRRACLDGRVR